jgi:hypothetical protein
MGQPRTFALPACPSLLPAQIAQRRSPTRCVRGCLRHKPGIQPSAFSSPQKMSTEYQLTFNDYVSILRRRGLLMVATLCRAACRCHRRGGRHPAGLPIHGHDPGGIADDSDRPDSLRRGEQVIDERIEVIRQRVMTRENLFKIIENIKFFRDTSESLTVSEKIDEMRKRIIASNRSAPTQIKRRRDQGTIAFKLSFEHRKPEIAQRVANELVTLFLDENVKSAPSGPRDNRVPDPGGGQAEGGAGKSRNPTGRLQAGAQQARCRNISNCAWSMLVAHRSGIKGCRTRPQDGPGRIALSRS